MLQAAEKVPSVRNICEKYEVNAAYLERRAKEVWPDFTVNHTLVDAPFSDEEKAVRLRFCYKYLDMPEEFWLRVVWVDEASLLLEPRPQPAVGERGTVVVVTDSRKQHHRYGCPHLNFCLAVNGYAGLVFHGFIHTTTGWSGKEYRVGKQPLTLLYN